ncbi:MAG: acyl carrier protein [Acidobacteriota bacterium]
MTRGAVQSVEDVVKNIIAAELRVSRDQLKPETHLMKDLGADSLDALNIALRLEEAFRIKIPDDAIPKFLTVSDIITGVNDHLSERQ